MPPVPDRVPSAADHSAADHRAAVHRAAARRAALRALLPGAGVDALLVTDLVKIIDRASALALAACVRGLGVGRLGFESDSVTVDAHSALDAAAEGVELRRAPGLVQQLRQVKDETEIAALRAACAAADAALADLLAAGGLAPGRTEREV